MSIRVTARVGGEAASRLRSHAATTAVAARVALADRLAEKTKADAAEGTPVDTGRLRRAWQDAEVVADDGGSVSSRRATNSVPYVGYVEYGTRRMAPRLVVRRAIQKAAAAAATLFRFGGGG